MIETTTNIKTEKQLIPAIRFKEFEGEWNKDKLGNLSSNISYGIGAAATEFDGVNKYLRITDIDEDTREFKPNPLTSPEGGAGDKYKLKKGDIVFARTGASVGKSYLYKETDGNLIYAGFLIKFNINKADPRFIYALTFNESYDKWVHVFSMRSGQPGLNAEEYKGFKINLPSLSEQQKIASFLSAVDEKIKQLTKKKALLEQYKKGVMQQLFSGHLRFKDESGNPYPDWEEKKMGDIMAVRNDQAPKSSEYPLMAFIKHIGVAPKGDRYNREFLVNDGEGKKYKKTEYGDFIYSSNNLDTGSIGLNRYGSACISPVYSIFQIKELCDYQFISRFLVRKSFINKMLRFRQGVVYGQWKIHESAVLKIKEKIPCLEEQQKIATYLSSIDTKIEAVNNQITQTQTFKKGLLQQMFV